MTGMERIRALLFDREYMSGVERSDDRIRRNGEVFTPGELVERILDDLPRELFSGPERTFLDPSCGDGQILAGILYRRLRNGIGFGTALQTLFGVDVMPDNVSVCRERLLCGHDEFRETVENNIVCADAQRYHMRFDGSHPYDDETAAAEKEKQFGRLFVKRNVEIHAT